MSGPAITPDAGAGFDTVSDRMSNAIGAEPAPGRFAALLETSLALRASLLAAFALVIRAPLLGEWNYDVDDQFYSLVGQRMLDGATLYVDIWDRKGSVLFLLYSAIAAISRSPVAYQVAATVSAVIAAVGIAQIAQGFGASGRAATMAGALYLALLNGYGGATGQTPVFYNTLLLAAAASILTRLDRLESGRIDGRIILGMACASLAIGMKQSEAIVSAFFGFYILRALLRSPAPHAMVGAQVVLLALIGSAPCLIAAAWYGYNGHFEEFWSATVSSNFSRTYVPTWLRLYNLAMLSGQLAPLLASLWLGYRSLIQSAGDVRAVHFVAAWAVAALLGLLAFPNVFDHYSLPLFPSLCILASGFFDRPRVGTLVFVALSCIALAMGKSLDIGARIRSHTLHREFATYVAGEVPEHRLFVFGRSSYLYALTKSSPLSPLAFGHHLFDIDEAGVSGIDDNREVARILAQRPEAVVLDADPKRQPTNIANARLVARYIARCRKVRRFDMYDRAGVANKLVFSDCTR